MHISFALTVVLVAVYWVKIIFLRKKHLNSENILKALLLMNKNVMVTGEK